ncbi:hypothetical protein GYMLUDRAFT_90502 [Collybiopsis luxurians FD-317 M1]|nr:hypothetical protein GYMLUDRAFT_90502 [Collybiopsis luxurians FD-317 M1]
MAIVQSGVRVWVIKAEKNEFTPPTVETKREENGDKITVEADAEFSVRYPKYYLEWQKTDSFPRHSKAICEIYTAGPGIHHWTQRGQSIQMISGQDHIVYSSRQSKIFGKVFEISSKNFRNENLERNKGVAGYIQLRVNFQLGEDEVANAATTSLQTVLFTFTIRYVPKKVRKEPDVDPNHHPEGAAGRAQSAVKVNVEHPQIKDPKAIYIDLTEDGAEPSPESKAGPQTTTSKRGGETRERSFEFGFALNIAAAERGLEEASIAYSQAQLERWDAILEKRKLLEAETKRLNEGTGRIRDDSRRFKKRKL